MHTVKANIMAVVVSFLVLSGGPSFAQETTWLSGLDLSVVRQGWGEAQIDRSVQGQRLTLCGRTFERGVGTHAHSVMHVELDGKVDRFAALVGVDDETDGRGSVVFRVYADGHKLFDSGVLKGGDRPLSVDVPLANARRLMLLVTGADDGIDYDHADWAQARFIHSGRAPQSVADPPEEKVILTPKAGPEPRINGPLVYGCRPGRPFLYRIPCTGQRPLTFAAVDLPDTLALDSATGIISGRAPSRRGDYPVTLKAGNAQGTSERPFAIHVGETLALTPPMGWNHWYTFYTRVTDTLFRRAADSLIQSGLADFGYQYVNIDDCWMVKTDAEDPNIAGAPRDDQGRIRANGNFPDMKALTDYIHSLGLKAGIYTSPGPLTCQGYTGTYQHEQQDAQQFADWGFDFLKYDWCSYGRVAGGNSLDDLKRPYIRMGALLQELDRDVVFNLCQYGMGEVWQWGGEVGGHCWRTTGDLGLERSTRLPGFYAIGLSNARHAEHARPGRWNDPDYILIGMVGNAWNLDEPARPTSLTPNEQYAYMSMWSLMAAPLIYSGDVTQLDEFTLNVLCNHEVIAVDQDPLGVQARVVRQDDEQLIMAKPLHDGSLAVGLFNLDEVAKEMAVSWSDLSVAGPHRVRDLWRQKDLGRFERAYSAPVGRHGVMLIRLTRQPR